MIYRNLTTISCDGWITAYRCAAFSGIDIEKLISIGAKWSKSDTLWMKQICADMTPAGCKEMFAAHYKKYLLLNPEPQFDNFAKNILEMWLDDNDTGMPDEKIAQITAPVLAIRGNEDGLFSLESAVKLLSRIPSAQFLNIPFVSHEAYKDQMDTVIHFSRLFLNQHKP